MSAGRVSSEAPKRAVKNQLCIIWQSLLSSQFAVLHCYVHLPSVCYAYETRGASEWEEEDEEGEHKTKWLSGTGK